MTDKEKIKKTIKSYQGKYLNKKENYNDDTYVHIKKIFDIGDNLCTYFHAYADIIYKRDNEIVFAQNTYWNFGQYHIRRYNYKEISKSVFNKILNQYGFTINKHSINYTVERKSINV